MALYYAPLRIQRWSDMAVEIKPMGYIAAVPAPQPGCVAFIPVFETEQACVAAYPGAGVICINDNEEDEISSPAS